MPGILPMKVIKVGNSSQSRIAQACDRCRSKKIRCDGLRPCCGQCSAVGFECRTSDKLSRRAFPRGYTESLEERVRALEAEVRELKDLLDEKDEKIDILSKMHDNRSPSINQSAEKSPSPDANDAGSPAKEDTFRVQASPLLLGVENSDSYFMGASSGRAFIEAFKRKIQENGKACSEFNPEAFLHIQGCYPLTPKPQSLSTKIPPRLFSDRCVNVYFQEWAPLFPVLHKPTFLRVYEEFVADPEKVKNHHKLAQLNLVFGIAALSSEEPDLPQIAACESQWQLSLEAILMDNTMITLQCLVLALMYCTIRADYKRLQYYKGIAVGLSHRLGLHQSQKRFSFGALTIETRKKVFWTLYTLDCFSAAILGLPKMLKDVDVHTESPSDVDDEYVTEKGFQPCLPGEHTRISSALALFRGTRILGKVLEKNYPAATSHELSLQQMSSLEEELDQWSNNLPRHLKLNFKQDKPSTDVTGSRSPLLALAYYYIRTLIYRPAVGSGLGAKATPALISIGESSKHIVQIIQLLEERNMSFSFCLNKSDTLVLCGMALLYQCVDLNQDSKLMKDNEKHVNAVIRIVDKAKALGSYDLKRVAGIIVTLDEPLQAATIPTPRQSPEVLMGPPSRTSPSASSSVLGMSQTLGRHPSASASETDLLLQQEKLRRMTMAQPSQARPDLYRSRSRPSLDKLSQDQALPFARRDRRFSLSQAQAAQAAMVARMSPVENENKQNLDFLPINSPQPSSPAQAPGLLQPQGRIGLPQQMAEPQSQLQAQLHQKGPQVSVADWEAMLGSLDGGFNNVYDAIYGGPAVLGLTPAAAKATSSTTPPSGLPIVATVSGVSWRPESWDLSGFNLDDFGPVAGSIATQSALSSLSEDGLSSGEDLAPSEMGLSATSMDYQAQILSATGRSPGGFALDGLDARFGL